MRRHRSRWLIPTVVALVAVAAIVGAILASSGAGGGSQTAGQGHGPARSTAADDPSGAYERAVNTAMPSVVQIQAGNSVGSGVVLDGSGDIVTNAHVVGGSNRFRVITADGRQRDATLRGSFVQGDLAVVRVSDTGGLRAAQFADSSKVQVGQAVLALGSPLGLRSSVTDGIISARSRTVPEPNGVVLPSVVQTSAAINPGNSGGALVDLTGAVVGIPTLAATDPEVGGVANGVGFAISSNTAKRIGDQLAQKGRVVSSGRAFLGVELRSLPAGGALIAGVKPGGPAAKAGIRPGEVLVSVAGTQVQSVDDVALILAERHPGDKVAVVVLAPDGRRQTVQVTLGDAAAGS